MYNGDFDFFWQLRRQVAGRSSEIFQFCFLQFVLHKNEQLLKYLTDGPLKPFWTEGQNKKKTIFLRQHLKITNAKECQFYQRIFI